jgi:hypothetical protein
MNNLNSKGLLNFLLVLLFVSLLFSFFSLDGFSQKKLGKNLQLLLEAEQASFFRTLLEENTDTLVEETIKFEVLKGNTAPRKLKKKIVQNLLTFFSKTEKEFKENPEIVFFTARISSENYEEFSKTELTEKDIGLLLKKNSKVNVIKLKNAYLVEFVFTGGKNKKEVITARISFENMNSYFFIPAGFSKKVLVVGV